MAEMKDSYEDQLRECMGIVGQVATKCDVHLCFAAGAIAAGPPYEGKLLALYGITEAARFVRTALAERVAESDVTCNICDAEKGEED